MLKTNLRKEYKKLQSLEFSRYLLFVEQPLTARKKEEICGIFGNKIQSNEDIWGREDIEEYLVRNPDIEKRHPKLWLKSSAILERIVHADLENYTGITEANIKSKIQKFVSNPSVVEAFEKIDTEGILILCGAPGVGKTTLAQFIAFHYLQNGYRIVSMRSLNDGFRSIHQSGPTIYFFDDFLGQIELQRELLNQQAGPFLDFLHAIKSSKTSKFVLTTRAHIFREATKFSDRMKEQVIQLAEYLLDVGSYTRKIKAEIFLNHLYFSALPAEAKSALLENDKLKRIVDHKNYSPRMMEWVTSAAVRSELSDMNYYPNYVLEKLDDPERLWESAYEALSLEQKNLLTCIFFSNDYSLKLDELETIFGEFNPQICRHFNEAISPHAFRDSVKILDGGFISISGTSVRFVNPSLSDFLDKYLADFGYLQLICDKVTSCKWYIQVWGLSKKYFAKDNGRLSLLAIAYVSILPNIESSPSTIRREGKNSNYHFFEDHDASISDRLGILLELFNATQNDRFLQTFSNLIFPRRLNLKSKEDGQELPRIISELRDGYRFDEHTLASHNISVFQIESLIEMCLLDYLNSEEALSVVSAIDEFMADDISKSLQDVMKQAVANEVSSIIENQHNFDSTSICEETIEELNKLSQLTKADVSDATELLERLAEEHEAVEQAKAAQMEDEWTCPEHRINSSEQFSDEELISLFTNLV